MEQSQTERDHFLKCSHCGASFATGCAPVNHNAHHSNRGFCLVFCLSYVTSWVTNPAQNDTSYQNVTYHSRAHVPLFVQFCNFLNSMRNTHNFKFHAKEKYKRADHAHLLSRRLILSVYSRGKKAKKYQLSLSPEVKRSMHGLTIGAVKC